MVGLQNNLYYLPIQAQIENVPFTQHMWVYDIALDEWSQGPALPEPLENASMTICEGKLVVEGETMTLVDGSPMTSEDKTEVVYTFNPVEGAWAAGCADGLSLGATLVNLQSKVLAVGGSAATTRTIDADAAVDPARRVVAFDPQTGAGELFATTDGSYTNPQAVACGSGLLVYGDAKTPEACEIVFAGDEAQKADMPQFLPASATNRAFAAVVDGAMMVGPASADGQADTFMLNAGTTSFLPFVKVASDAMVFHPAACAYDGQLYVMAASEVEPDRRLFRSTAIQTVADANDVSLAPSPEPQPTLTPTPASTSDNATGADASPATGDGVGAFAMMALLAVLAAGTVLAVAAACLRKKEHR